MDTLEFEQQLRDLWAKRPQGSQPRAALAQKRSPLAEELIEVACRDCQTPEDQEAIASWHGWYRPDALSWEYATDRRCTGVDDFLRWLLDNRHEWMNGAVNDCEFDDAHSILLKTRIQVGSPKQIRWAGDLMRSPEAIEALAIVRRTIPTPKIPTGAEWWINNRENLLEAFQRYQQGHGRKPAFIADLDGSLRQTVSGETFINDPDDQEAMAGAVEALNTVPYECIGCTNQLGVKLEYKSFMDTVKEQQRTLELFPKLKAVLFCPDDGETCWCVLRDRFWRISDDYPHTTIHSFRKPGPGMLFIAMSLAGANPEDSVMIGDRPEDEAAAQAANVQFQWADDFRANGLRGATAL
jgi:D-glycero-D-manno-heptose 1,7-bisphosphate phosphatase